MERRETVALFRERLVAVIERSGLTRAAFASSIGLDRSTLSQLLSPDNQRLPRTETVISIAQQAQVSTDWLLGLSQEERIGTELIAGTPEIEPGAASPLDARLQRWHAEAAGYKIRYVPTTLPDLLKTEEVIRYEYQDYGSETSQSLLEQAEARLAYSRRPETEMEACCAFQVVESFARGEGIWRNLPADLRRQQIEHMKELSDELYPTFRWFLYDGLQRFSVPLTIFGPKRAAVYMGNMYFVFNATEQIRVLTRHFDGLIRNAIIQPPDVIAYLDGLLLLVQADGTRERKEVKKQP